jgi:hypothetical protein
MDIAADPIIAVATGGWRGLLLVAAAVLAGAWLHANVDKWHRRSRRHSKRSDFRALLARKRRSPPSQPASPTFDGAEQLRVVERAIFRRQKLLNRGEARLLRVLDDACAAVAPDWRVMAQVSLGEILKSPDESAYRAINSKRVDLLIVGPDGEALHAVEFQGSGHHLGPAATRDAIKREALRRAGIGYLEVKQGDTPAEIRTNVAKLARSRPEPV